MRMMYGSFLSGSSFQALFATTTRQAIEILDRIRPAAIVLDIVLRSEDTWSFLAQLTAETRTSDVPILVASTIEDQAKAFHLGARDYIIKPVERLEFLSRLRALTGQTPIKRVLIIDDNERDRYLLKRQLIDSSFSISEAFNGYDGFKNACEQRPDIIVLDLNMPGLSGFEVLEQLKSEGATRDIPVVICTSRILTNTEQKQLTGRAAAILSKEDLGHRAVAQELQRVIHAAGLAAAIEQGQTA
jgi:CheY-like chemotaxis protein